ncbi:MAG: isopropylmalate isomerase, partial [Verrucomicrobiota bacterium]|nr:isopropylmalate isomerase [Verrucomicrobiota bacterium]
YRAGFRAVIAGNFAEIFFGNAINLGMPCVSMSDSCRRSLANLLNGRPESPVTIDVKELQVRVEGDSFPVELRAGARDSLLNGTWDPLDELLGKTDRVDKLAASLHYV